MLQKRLGQRIAALRKRRRLTQAQLAKAVACLVEFISLVQRGLNAPSVAGLEKFARVLRVEGRDLFMFDQRQRRRKAHALKLPSDQSVASVFNL